MCRLCLVVEKGDWDRGIGGMICQNQWCIVNGSSGAVLSEQLFASVSMVGTEWSPEAELIPIAAAGSFSVMSSMIGKSGMTTSMCPI